MFRRIVVKVKIITSLLAILKTVLLFSLITCSCTFFVQADASINNMQYLASKLTYKDGTLILIVEYKGSPQHDCRGANTVQSLVSFILAKRIESPFCIIVSF